MHKENNGDCEWILLVDTWGTMSCLASSNKPEAEVGAARMGQNMQGGGIFLWVSWSSKIHGVR